MSHFTVLVIGDDVEGQLQPYHEYECTGTEDQYVVWVDYSDELQGWYDKYAAEGEDLAKFAKGEGLTLRDGKWMRKTNPNAKWDWWQVGGRWTGFWKLKPGCLGEVGQPGLMTQPPEPGYADSARKHDIDFDAMRTEAGNRARTEFAQLMAAVGDLPVPAKPWSKFRLDYGEDIDAARDAWHQQPFIQAALKARVCFTDPVEEFCLHEGGEAAFVRRAELHAGCTYAVVYDGQWHQQGEMGWFGLDTPDMSPQEWHALYHELVAKQPGGTLLTVVDCHI